MAVDKVMNRYTKLDENTTVLEIETNQNKIFKLLVDSDIVPQLKEKQWLLRNKKDTRNYVTVFCRETVDRRTTENVRNRKYLSLRKFIYAVKKGIDIKEVDSLRLKKMSEDGIEYDFRFSNITKSENTFQMFEEEGMKNWKQGLAKRYSKEWSKSLKNVSTSKVDMEIALEIRKLALDFSQQEICEKYGVGRTTVTDIVNFRTWNPFAYDDILIEEIKDKEYQCQNIQINWEDNESEDLPKQQLKDIEYAKFTDGNFDIYFKFIGDFQFYLEYYYNNIFIGSSQHAIENPYKKMDNRFKNNQILILNKDKYGYAKEQNVILNNKKVYAILNAIKKSLIYS